MNHTTLTQPSAASGFLSRSRSLLTVITLLSAMPGLVNAAVMASLDRNTIYTGDTATLRITTSGNDAGKQPDLAPLQKDFEILGTSTSNQIQIINGQRSDKHEWLIELSPLTKGDIPVPSLRIGDSKTTALTLKVSDQPAAATAQAGAPVFIRSEVNSDQDDAYVQQQILYTTRLYYRVPLIEGNFSDPEIDNAVIEQLGEDKQYNTTLDRQNYQVVERSYAIFPEHSGKLTITPTVFTGRTVSATGQRSSLSRMDSLVEQMLSQRGFNNQFFGGTPFGDAGKRVHLASNTLTLDVKPRPNTYQGVNWLPTQKLILQDSWAKSAPVIHAGEPVTRTLTLEAKGLEASQLPKLSLEGTNTLRVYPEQPELSNRTDGDWIYGRSEQRYTYVASQPGKLSVPAIQVSWWDSVNHKQQNTMLPAWEVMVEPGSGTTATPTTAAGATASPANPVTQAQTSDAKSTEAVTATTESHGMNNLLYWRLGGGLGLLILLSGVFLFLRRQRKPAPAEPTVAQNNPLPTAQLVRTKEHEAVKRSREMLRDACNTSNPQSAAVALLDWAAATWPDQPPRSLGALAARVKRGAEVIRALETVLYGANKQDWNGELLWKTFAEGLLQPDKPTAQSSQIEAAPPLYPDWRKQAG